MKAIAGLDYAVSIGGPQAVGVGFFDGSPEACVDAQNIQFDMADATDANSLITAATAAINAYATLMGYTLSEGIFWTYPIAGTGTRTFANPTCSLNSAFQVSATKDAQVSYTVDIAAALSLSGGATGTVTLKYADDSAFTTNVVTVQSSVNGNSGTLTVGLNLTQTASASLNGVIPAGKYVKLVTANTTGTPTFTFRAAQEVLI